MTDPAARRFERARRYLAGGVSSPVRSFAAVGGTPVFFDSGRGARVRDADGREYIDYVGSWGPLIAGHAHPRVVAALSAQAERGSSFGAPTELETELGRRIVERVPSCARVRFVSSGTEATMSAIRLARAATGREEIVKLDGCYHGHADALLAPSPGVPAALAALTHVLPFHDDDAVERLFAERGPRIACLIAEPVPGNMGVVPPRPAYLERLGELCRRHGALYVLDEVITGFRVHRGGAQALYRLEPDLSCFGKVVGGGLPAAAYAGSPELMRLLAPDGPVYQAGTLSGNPLAMCAGAATLDLLDDAAYAALERAGARLQQALEHAARAAGVPLVVQRVGSMLTPFFTSGPVLDRRSAATSDTARYAKFFHALLARGVYAPPSQFEAWFVSLAHGEEELGRTAQALDAAFEESR